MKIITNYIIMIWAIVSLGLLPIHGSEATKPKAALNIGNIENGKLDRELLAIAADPNMLHKIDQRQNFKNDGAYLDILLTALDQANKLIPNAVNKYGSENITVSVCVADSRVYFWNALDDRDVIGWISIPELDGEITENPKVTLWIVPRLPSENRFAKNAREDAMRDRVALKTALIKSVMDLDIVDAETCDKEQVCGTIKLKGDKHKIKVCTSGNIMQAEIMLSPDGIVDGYAIVEVGKGVLKDIPRVLPFWPPK
jgi:hypothetical protein